MSLVDLEQFVQEKDLEIDQEEALWFLHHILGVLLYYPEEETLVIFDKQVVFDSITNLIVKVFTL